MDLNNEIMKKGAAAVEAEITTKIKVHNYITATCLIVSLVLCVMYSREYELSKAKSNQLEQRAARINEKNDTIKLLEELNINLSKTQ